MCIRDRHKPLREEVIRLRQVQNAVDTAPVSSTHLDVYKRQVILSAKSKGSEDMKKILIVEDDSFLNKMLAYNQMCIRDRCNQGIIFKHYFNNDME